MVNEYRIHEILIWMTNRENANLSFEGMALKAGFYNRTTFYESFKQINGLKKDFKWTLVTHILVFGTFNSINTL